MICLVYSPVKLKTNEAENSWKFENSQPQSKIYGSYRKRVYSEDLFLYNARNRNLVKRMGLRPKLLKAWN